jgi:hemerythrin-like domain-containing protein
MDMNKQEDACDLLEADHDAVKEMFSEYNELIEDQEGGSNNSEDRRLLAEKICQALTVHAQIEEEIFYPGVREGVDDDLMMDEARVEHASAKGLIAQIQEMDPENPVYDAMVRVLGEYVDHHIEEEQNEIFPRARESDVDLTQMREQMMARKQELNAGAEEMSRV